MPTLLLVALAFIVCGALATWGQIYLQSYLGGKMVGALVSTVWLMLVMILPSYLTGRLRTEFLFTTAGGSRELYQLCYALTYFLSIAAGIGAFIWFSPQRWEVLKERLKDGEHGRLLAFGRVGDRLVFHSRNLKKEVRKEKDASVAIRRLVEWIGPDGSVFEIHWGDGSTWVLEDYVPSAAWLVERLREAGYEFPPLEEDAFTYREGPPTEREATVS